MEVVDALVEFSVIACRRDHEPEPIGEVAEVCQLGFIGIVGGLLVAAAGAWAIAPTAGRVRRLGNIVAPQSVLDVVTHHDHKRRLPVTLAEQPAPMLRARLERRASGQPF